MLKCKVFYHKFEEFNAKPNFKIKTKPCLNKALDNSSLIKLKVLSPVIYLFQVTLERDEVLEFLVLVPAVRWHDIKVLPLVAVAQDKIVHNDTLSVRVIGYILVLLMKSSLLLDHIFLRISILHKDRFWF